MSDTNAKQEFLKHISNKPKVKCVKLIGGNNYNENEVFYELGCGYNVDEWVNFLNKIDFNYNSGYGGQELFGLIWYEDGTWTNRGEYDGSEWYEYNKCPEVPDELRRIDIVRDNKINEITKND
jgi:hypothetical protein